MISRGGQVFKVIGMQNAPVGVTTSLVERAFPRMLSEYVRCIVGGISELTVGLLRRVNTSHHTTKALTGAAPLATLVPTSI
jgi:hypothetical protein